MHTFVDIFAQPVKYMLKFKEIVRMMYKTYSMLHFSSVPRVGAQNYVHVLYVYMQLFMCDNIKKLLESMQLYIIILVSNNLGCTQLDHTIQGLGSFLWPGRLADENFK